MQTATYSRARTTLGKGELGPSHIGTRLWLCYTRLWLCYTRLWLCATPDCGCATPDCGCATPDCGCYTRLSVNINHFKFMVMTVTQKLSWSTNTA
ncbi:uncharacterized [Tachysurus ichikawai]